MTIDFSEATEDLMEATVVMATNQIQNAIYAYGVTTNEDVGLRAALVVKGFSLKFSATVASERLADYVDVR